MKNILNSYPKQTMVLNKNMIVLLFILLLSMPVVANAQPQSTEMGSTSTMMYQPWAQGYATRNSDGLMSSGSQYASSIDENTNTTPPTTKPSGPHRVSGFPDIPFPDPIGDAILPLLLLAVGYVAIVTRKKRIAANK